MKRIVEFESDEVGWMRALLLVRMLWRWVLLKLSVELGLGLLVLVRQRRVC